MSINKSMVQGNMSMLVLRLLEEKDMYGYEITDTLKKRSNNVFELKAGSLYPLLHTLEDSGYVTAYEDDSTGKMRKYYKITSSGKHQLKTKKAEWTEFSQAILNVLGIVGGV